MDTKTGVKASSNIDSLDGLRAIAITFVFLAHGGLSEIVPGGLGVTLFFVLSGFLITTLMRVEFASTGTLDLPAFYSRRLLRLMPPLLIMVLITLLLDEASGTHVPPTLTGIASVVFYFSNYFTIFNLNGGIPDGLGITWSLAVEEHFYILFPLAALLLLRINRVMSVSLIGAVCLAVLAWRCWLIVHGSASQRVYMGTDTRVDSILIGCAMALVWNPVLDPVHDRVRRAAPAIAVLALAVLAGTLIYRSESFRFTYRFTVQGLAIMPLIYVAVAQSQHVAFRWLNAAPLTYLGKISYSVYLAHETCRVFIYDRWPSLGMVPSMLMTLLLVLAIAVPMRLWVEIPFAGIRKRLHERRAAAIPQLIASAFHK